MNPKAIATLLGSTASAAALLASLLASSASCDGRGGKPNEPQRTSPEHRSKDDATQAATSVDVASKSESEPADRGTTSTDGGPSTDPTGLSTCCAALWQTSMSAVPQLRGAYQAAGASCDAARRSGQNRDALARISRLLLSAAMPAACR